MFFLLGPRHSNFFSIIHCMIYPPYIYIYGFIYTRVYINAKAPRATDKNLPLNLPPLAVALAAFTGLLSPPLASSRLLSPLLASSRLFSPPLA